MDRDFRHMDACERNMRLLLRKRVERRRISRKLRNRQNPPTLIEETVLRRELSALQGEIHKHKRRVYDYLFTDLRRPNAAKLYVNVDLCRECGQEIQPLGDET